MVPVWAALATALISTAETPALAIVGVLAWPFVEYVAHRWAMHGIARAWPTLYKRVHGVHHKYPTDTSHFTIPVFVVVPVVAALIAALWLCGAPSPGALVGGLLAALAAYDIVHLGAHGLIALPFGGGIARRHAAHHADQSVAFGVTSGIVDALMGTRAPRHDWLCVVMGSGPDAERAYGQAMADGKNTFTMAPPGSRLAEVAGRRNMTDPGAAMVVQFADEVVVLAETHSGKKS